MADGGLTGALFGPLGLPGRVLHDLETISETAGGLPAFEQALLVRLDELGTEVRAMRAELTSTKEVAKELRDLMGDAVEHLPGHDSKADSRGPIARARDAITGQD